MKHRLCLRRSLLFQSRSAGGWVHVESVLRQIFPAVTSPSPAAHLSSPRRLLCSLASAWGRKNGRLRRPRVRLVPKQTPMGKQGLVHHWVLQGIQSCGVISLVLSVQSDSDCSFGCGFAWNDGGGGAHVVTVFSAWRTGSPFVKRLARVPAGQRLVNVNIAKDWRNFRVRE